MTLPWFLNPWAEVRLLREYLAFWKNDALKWSDLWHAQCCESRRLEAENADLRRRIAEVESHEPSAGNCGFCAERGDSNHASFVASIDMGNRL